MRYNLSVNIVLAAIYIFLKGCSISNYRNPSWSSIIYQAYANTSRVSTYLDRHTFGLSIDDQHVPLSASVFFGAINDSNGDGIADGVTLVAGLNDKIVVATNSH